MKKILAAIVASTFALSCASGFAADTVKKEELTKEQRTDMRNRADKLTAERAAAPTQANTATKPAPKAKKQHVKKTDKVSRRSAKKTQPKA